jgi:hypothetical protein
VAASNEVLLVRHEETDDYLAEGPRSFAECRA